MNFLIHTSGYEMETPYADKIAEAERILRQPPKPAYLPQLYEIEGVDLAEPVLFPEKWPKENPFLNLAPFPDSYSERIESSPRKIGDAFIALAEAAKRLQTVIETVIETVTETITKTVQPIIIKIGDNLEPIINLYPNKRVIYLAKHGKKRVQKKNINRIRKWIEKQGKTPSKKRSSRGYIKYIEKDGKKRAEFVP